MCQCVTFPCGVGMGPVCRRRRCSYCGAVSFCLRSGQQRAVWLSASLAQGHQNPDSITDPTDIIELCCCDDSGVPVCVFSSGTGPKNAFLACVHAL